MQSQKYNVAGNQYIKRDLKRLKKFKSLEKDIQDKIKIIIGGLQDHQASFSSFPFSVFITKASLNGKEIWFYKARIGITSCRLSASNGCRLIFGYIPADYIFVPILVYSASDEGTAYNINKKQIPLKHEGLKKIITEKLQSEF
ncbi:MAG: hypothetical protein WC505_01405 [Patescibacteria group bacterium]